jgi:ethanolamine utilization protein EutA
MVEKLLSVGIDIGTSTTQLILSELYIENMASAFSIPRISITDKNVIYESEILFTPIMEENLINSEEIKRFVEKQYVKAGIQKSDIQTGAIIITGETVRKENAKNVAHALSEFAGDFVVATAGPDLESIIAGKGAGSYAYSRENHATTVNLDIGGGTTNLVAFYDGDVLDTGCFDIGGRLIKINEKNIITYLSPKLEKIINTEGLKLKANKLVDLNELDRLITIMVQVLENIFNIGKKSPYYDLLITNKTITIQRNIDYISFSGGVADYIDNENRSDVFRYGDIGILLGKKIANSKLVEKFNVLASAETIRATVVGAGSHTTDVSGSTITYIENVLPLQNIPVLKLSGDDEKRIDSKGLSNVIREKLNWYEFEGERQIIALAIEGTRNPRYLHIQELASAIVTGMNEYINKGEPVIILVKEDMAKALGHSLVAKLPKKHPLVCIDTVQVQNGDYIDIGTPIGEGSVLPVVIKTLVFN